jgi:hypothetical protein
MAPVDYGPQLHIVDWVLVGVSLVFLVLRVYCKIWRHRGLWWDDHILIAAWVMSRALEHSLSQSPLTSPK